MRKKLFTLMALLVGAVSSSWSTPTTIFDASDSGWSKTGVDLTTGTTTVDDVTWYGRSGAEIGEDTHAFSDGTSFTKYVKTSGNSTFQYKSGSDNLAAVLTYTPTVAGTIKVYCKGGGKSTRNLYISQSITATNRDTQTALGSVSGGDGSSSLYGIAEASVEASSKVYIWVDNNMFIYGITFEEDTRSASDLSVVGGKENIILSTTGNYTLTKGVDYTTSSTGAITFSSSAEEVATVTSDGLIEAVAAGTTTITLNQAADATYRTKKISFVVNVNEPLALSATFLTPSETLDLSDADAASTMLNKTWTYDRPYFGNDGTNNYITFTVLSAFSSKANETWVQVPTVEEKTGATTGENWSASGVFKGYTSYSGNTTATGQSGRAYTFYSFRVTGVSKVQLLVKGSAANAATLAAYEITAGTPASSTLYYVNCSSTSVETLTLNLDDSKEYLLTVNNALNTSNSRFYEMALFYDEAVTLYEPISAASGKTYATYVTKNAVDFSAVPSEITAYTAESVSASSVTLTQKDNAPAGTPLLVKMASAGGSANVPYAASTDAVGTNLLVAGDGTAVQSDGTNYVYVLQSGKFMLVEESYPTPPTVPVGKAYLSTTTVTAPVLDIESEVTTAIQSVETTQKGLLDGDFYNIAGQRVSHPTKGLYIVNGKKVIVK